MPANAHSYPLYPLRRSAEWGQHPRKGKSSGSGVFTSAGLPSQKASDIVCFRSPITAAAPHGICTRFLIKRPIKGVPFLLFSLHMLRNPHALYKHPYSLSMRNVLRHSGMDRLRLTAGFGGAERRRRSPHYRCAGGMMLIKGVGVKILSVYGFPGNSPSGIQGKTSPNGRTARRISEALRDTCSIHTVYNCDSSASRSVPQKTETEQRGFANRIPPGGLRTSGEANTIKAIPHDSGAQIAKSEFSSDCLKCTRCAP